MFKYVLTSFRGYKLSCLVFLIAFALFKLGRFADYISMPVMSGTALSIMLGQLPKILGIAGNGNDFIGNLQAIVTGIGGTSLLSLLLGGATVALVLWGKKFLPRVPVGLIVMVVGTALCGLLRKAGQVLQPIRCVHPGREHHDAVNAYPAQDEPAQGCSAYAGQSFQTWAFDTGLGAY